MTLLAYKESIKLDIYQCYTSSKYISYFLYVGDVVIIEDLGISDLLINVHERRLIITLTIKV